MKDKSIRKLSRMGNKELNESRRAVIEAMAELKLVEKNLKLLVNQNILDQTPTLLSSENTGEQERAFASHKAMDALDRARQGLSGLLD
jgi:hypothetical protein